MILFLVPCEVNLELRAYNSLGHSFELTDRLLLNSNGDETTLTCINRGARGLGDAGKPWLEIQYKLDGSSTYKDFTSDDGVTITVRPLAAHVNCLE